MIPSGKVIMTTLLALTLASPPPVAPQATPAPKPVPPTPQAPAASTPAPAADPALDAAEELIGKALFLRGFYAANELSYQPGGKVDGDPKTLDWTLAGVNVTKATRRSPAELELEGVRVAIRYNPDAHEFQRHPLTDQKMKILLRLAPAPAPGVAAEEARALRATLGAIFSFGIDPPLQRSMPPLWRHYFDPSLAWPADALGSATIYPMYGLPDQPRDVAPPQLTKKVDAAFTDAASHDKVKGTVQMRMVIDTEGIPRRISVTRPLGYGLEEKTAEAMEKWRFTPAIRAGAPVPSAIVVNLDFETAPPQK